MDEKSQQKLKSLFGEYIKEDSVRKDISFLFEDKTEEEVIEQFANMINYFVSGKKVFSNNK